MCNYLLLNAYAHRVNIVVLSGIAACSNVETLFITSLVQAQDREGQGVKGVSLLFWCSFQFLPDLRVPLSGNFLL